jgi:hypothetical protein
MGTTDFDSKVVTYVSSVSESTYPVIDSSVIELMPVIESWKHRVIESLEAGRGEWTGLS